MSHMIDYLLKNHPKNILPYKGNTGSILCHFLRVLKQIAVSLTDSVSSLPYWLRSSCYQSPWLAGVGMLITLRVQVPNN